MITLISIYVLFGVLVIAININRRKKENAHHSKETLQLYNLWHRAERERKWGEFILTLKTIHTRILNRAGSPIKRIGLLLVALSGILWILTFLHWLFFISRSYEYFDRLFYIGHRGYFFISMPALVLLILGLSMFFGLLEKCIKWIKTGTILALTLSSLILGCATNKGGYRTERAVEDQLMKMTKEEVLIDLGPPAKKAALDSVRESWRYESAVGGLTGGECTLSILFTGDKVAQAKLSANDRSWVSWPLGSCTKIIQTLR